LCRIFRRETGVTIHEYRTRLRLRRAVASFRDGDVDLLALALDLGYSSHSHFTSSFRSEFGETPSAIRARLQSNQSGDILKS
jgi:AraC family transcriptional regulator